MKQLYSGKGKRVHPSSPPSSPFDLIAALPAAVLIIATALTSEEREVLVYLLSGEDKVAGKMKTQLYPRHRQQSHPPELGCDCFGCYKSFWARWDASPNRHLIHQILDAVEQSVEPHQIQSISSGRRRHRRRHRQVFTEEASPAAEKKGNPADKGEGFVVDYGEEEEEKIGEAAAGGDNRGTVRRLVSFIGERVRGVWN